MKKTVAIVLAAGQGKRMNTETPKQYLVLEGKPVLVYSLETFQKSFIDEIVIVVQEGEIEYCKKEIVDKYHITKVTSIVEGGEERYHSVYKGLCVCEGAGYVYIHDGARPFIQEKTLEDLRECVLEWDACVAAVPAKDTIRITDESGFASFTPDRNKVWIIQTPQVFLYPMIMESYRILIGREKEYIKGIPMVTDDAMVLETYGGKFVKLVNSTYSNIKITTPEDILIAKEILNSR